MAIYEQPKEDLLGRATQFPIRCVWVAATSEAVAGAVGATGGESAFGDADKREGRAAPSFRHAVGGRGPLPKNIFWGKRRDGGWSLFVDEDPVLHINGRQELRRLYFQGRKYAAASGRLEVLERVRYGGRLQHRRTVLAPDEQFRILSQVHAAVLDAIAAIESGRLRWGGGVQCDQADASRQLCGLIEALGESIPVAAVPNA
ncbi:MAG: hypothetical protein D6753_01665 [Planctomycetota bacterium]|nr:MAG: hypothetical protein D6753_01665 [Planctomycetota bacterium]